MKKKKNIWKKKWKKKLFFKKKIPLKQPSTPKKTCKTLKNKKNFMLRLIGKTIKTKFFEKKKTLENKHSKKIQKKCFGKETLFEKETTLWKKSLKKKKPVGKIWKRKQNPYFSKKKKDNETKKNSTTFRKETPQTNPFAKKKKTFATKNLWKNRKN